MHGPTRSVVLAILLAIAGRPSFAADQLLAGKKLLIKNPPSGTNKIVHLAKDATITVSPAGSSGDPRCTGAGGGGTSSLRIATASAGDVTIPLPCAGWSANAANSQYKYIDASGATCRLVLVKGARLVKAVCTGPQVAVALGGTTAPVGVETTLNGVRYCTEFGGTQVKDGSDGRTLLHKDAGPAAACPTTSTTTSSTSSTSTSSTTTLPLCSFTTTWGSLGSANGQFNNPTSAALDASGNVYVVDVGNARIQKFTSSGTFLTAWGSNGAGDGQFSRPIAVAVDASSNVYVVDADHNRIQKFTSTGTFLTKWGSAGTGNGQFDFEIGLGLGGGVAVDGSGNVYVADYDNDRIQKFTSTGTFLTAWGTFGSGNGQLDGPAAVAVDGSGNVYVADVGNDRIQKFTTGGTFVLKWGAPGSGPGQFNAGRGVAVDGAGRVYVSDFLEDTVQVFLGDGTFVGGFGTSGSGNGQLSAPHQLAIDASGNVFVPEGGNHRVQKFDCP